MYPPQTPTTGGHTPQGHAAWRLSTGVAGLLFSMLALLLIFGLGRAPAGVQAAPLTQRDGGIAGVAVTKTVQMAASPVQVGEVISYTTRLQNTDARNTREFGILEEVPWPLRLAGRVQVDGVRVAANVNTVRGEDGRVHTTVSWRGEIPADGYVEVRIPVRVDVVCRPDVEIRPMMSTATIREYVDGRPTTSMTEDAPYTVACPQQATVDDIQVEVEVLSEDDLRTPRPAGDNRAGNPTEELFGAYNFLITRVHLTNRADVQAVVGYRLDLKSFIGETEKNLTDGDTYTPLILAPGETRTAEVWTDMRPHYAVVWDELMEVDPYWGFHVSHLLLPAVQARATAVVPDENAVIRTEIRNVRTRGWDLGDAPDSSNHAGVTMDAYPNVQANFATVFNPAVSPVSGPAHMHPRHFHLGRSVSLEADADLGIAPNIDPTASQADMDLVDDSVNPSAWQLTHCEATTIDARIFVSPRAAAWFADNSQRGYLNVWIDSNRDGDWGDRYACPAGPAFDHIVIDHPIDVAGLGAGYHTVSVPTGLVHWSAELAQRPAWVRVMLGERPSLKVNQGGSPEFGDGRGPNRPYLLGETEDYLLRPAGSAGSGPNLEVSIEGTVRPVLDVELVPAAADFTYQKIEWTWRVDFSNRGNAIAESAQLHFDFPEGLTTEQIREGAVLTLVAPRRDAQTIYYRSGQTGYDLEGNRATLQVGDLAPGEEGRLLVRFELSRQLVEALGSEVVVWSAVNASGELDPESSRTSFKAVSGMDELITWGEAGLVARSPHSPFWVQQGATNSRELRFQGFIPTGETAIFLKDDGQLEEDLPANRGVVTIWVYELLDAARTDMEPEARIAAEYLAPGVYVEEVSFRANGDGTGFWEWILDELGNGFYQVAVGHPDACEAQASRLAGNDNEWRFRAQPSVGFGCGRFLVDTSLPFDPMSLAFVEVPADAAQAVIGDDGSINGRVYYPSVLTYPDFLDVQVFEGEWYVRLPRGEYAAVFSVAEDIAPEKALLVHRLGDDVRSVAQVETAIPAFHNRTFVTERFFFDEADALFGSLLSLQIETEDEVREFRGTARETSAGRILPLNPDVEPLNSLLYILRTRDGRNFGLWNGQDHGQPNPVRPDAGGRFDITLPDGFYQLVVQGEGHQPYRSEVFRGNGPIEREIYLYPHTDGILDELEKIIVLDQDGGMTPSVVDVAPGSEVVFISMDEKPRLLLLGGSLNDKFVIPAQAGGFTLRSPELLLGESFSVQVGESGQVVVEDEYAPGVSALLRITDSPSQPGDPSDPGDPDDADDQSVFLPQLSR